jgi:hypothetical protein
MRSERPLEQVVNAVEVVSIDDPLEPDLGGFGVSCLCGDGDAAFAAPSSAWVRRRISCPTLKRCSMPK